MIILSTYSSYNNFVKTTSEIHLKKKKNIVKYTSQNENKIIFLGARDGRHKRWKN